MSRKIDTLISSGLFDLPIPGVEATGSNVLAFRNMIRAVLYSMPSGQTVAKKMGIPVIPPNQVTTLPGFENGSPLWYYILKESELGGGTKLGPVGARIVADIFLRLLQIDKDSILNGNQGDNQNQDQQGQHDDRFLPEPPIAPAEGQFTFADFLVFAGVATRP